MNLDDYSNPYTLERVFCVGCILQEYVFCKPEYLMELKMSGDCTHRVSARMVTFEQKAFINTTCRDCELNTNGCKPEYKKEFQMLGKCYYLRLRKL